MDINFCLRQNLVEVGHCRGVVVVAMGQENIFHLTVHLIQGEQDLLRLVAGVNNGGLAGGFILQNVAVCADGAYLHHFDFHRHSLLRFLSVK